MVRGGRGPESPEQVAQRLKAAGLSAAVVELYSQGLEGSQLNFALRFDEGIPMLQRCAEGLRREGHDSTAHSADRLLMVFLLLANRTGELRGLLQRVASSPHSERREYVDLFRGLLQWQDGSTQLLQAQCRVLPERPPGDSHPLLPRPHFRDYLPAVFRALRDCALDLPPDPSLVPQFEQALSRLRFYYATGLGGVVAVLRLATAVPDPVLNPRYAMLVTRLWLRHGVQGGAEAQAFLPLFDQAWGDWDCPGLPGQTVGICRELLQHGGSLASGRQLSELEAMVVTRVTELSAPDPEAQVAEDLGALRQYLRDHWNQPIHLRSYARERGQSVDRISRRFTRAFGVSPKRYQTETRVSRASRMMLETNWDLTAVALECGFYDAPQLTRTFREHRGISPQEFRRRFA